ncbi:MAG: CRISPR-associated endonuclease Cas2 [Deltaproteobacteria bacterium]|nr:CRISPR-associated endonuclease Cas2 [Deltaproteobacteria bacterium]
MLHVVVCYDVTSDARRARLCDGLKSYLEHVQYSVFEGRVGARDYAAVVRLVDDTIDPGEDDVRIYRLCPRCRGTLELFGQAGHVATEAEDVVIG